MSAWYIGADPASLLGGVAAINEDGRVIGANIRGNAKEDVPHRLASMRRQLALFFNGIADDGVWCVAIEKPVTRHGNAALLGSYGVFAEVAAATLPCAVLTLTTAEVDRAVHGSGIAARDRKARSMEYARSLGYEGTSQDVADALVAAAAGRALTYKAVA